MSKITGIEINKYFKSILQSDPILTSYVKKSNIQPLVLAPTNYPFVSFTHDEIIPEYSKDGAVFDNCIEIVAVVDTDYERSIGIISRIREIFEYQSFSDEKIKIPDFTVVSIDEDVISNAFVQHIIFKFEVHTK